MRITRSTANGNNVLTMNINETGKLFSESGVDVGSIEETVEFLSLMNINETDKLFSESGVDVGSIEETVEFLSLMNINETDKLFSESGVDVGSIEETVELHSLTYNQNNIIIIICIIINTLYSTMK